ncbi:DNA gyrase C-terminal beta-propeller domain-containing protein, partial [Janibacter hoylei]|uniref:DNA gyrase C-terminal beta-propeller domain-containing protein n=1 Tax=Janibacter hoylei TaxID=364298 RepID=UPI0023796C86
SACSRRSPARAVGSSCLVVDEDDEVMVVMEKGNIVRSAVAEVNRTSRNTQGVSFASPRKGDEIVAVARNVDRGEDAEPGDEQVASDPDVQSAGEVPAETAQQGDAPGGDQE